MRRVGPNADAIVPHGGPPSSGSSAILAKYDSNGGLVGSTEYNDDSGNDVG
jgi:hypothetical protein